MLAPCWINDQSIKKLHQRTTEGGATYLRIVEQITGGRIDGNRSGIGHWVWLLTSMKLESFEFWCSALARWNGAAFVSTGLSGEDKTKDSLVKFGERHDGAGGMGGEKGLLDPP